MVLSAWVPADLSCLQTVSHQYFWYHSILYASGHIDEGIQVLVLKLTLGIFAAWSLLALTMITGLKTSMPVSHPVRRCHLHVTFANPEILGLPAPTPPNPFRLPSLLQCL